MKNNNSLTAKDLQSLINARSRQSGAAFEELVNRSCDYYEEQGLAKIEKTPEPMKVLANLGGGFFKAVFTKQAQPDYKGTLRGGKAIVFEAKHTDTDRIKRSVITEEQEKCLNAYEKIGACCFVLVSFRLQKFYMLPWKIFRDMKQYFGRQYIHRDDHEIIKGAEVKCVGDTLRFLYSCLAREIK